MPCFKTPLTSTTTSRHGMYRSHSMDGMFDGARSFNQDLSLWNVTSVTTMDVMFRNAVSFDVDVTSWCLLDDADATLPCTHMRADEMFSGATAFGEKFYWVGLAEEAGNGNGPAVNWDLRGDSPSPPPVPPSPPPRPPRPPSPPPPPSPPLRHLRPLLSLRFLRRLLLHPMCRKDRGNSPRLFDASCVCRR